MGRRPPDRHPDLPSQGAPTLDGPRPARQWDSRPARPWEGAGRPHQGPGRPGPRPWQDRGDQGRPYRPAADTAEILELEEGEELVAGRRPVEEAFVARREAKRLLVVPQRRLALEKLVLHATSLRIPVVEVEGGSLTAIAGFDGHQGVALVVAPRQWAGLDDILAVAAVRGEPPLVLVLDSLEDPQNVGTLLRSAEASGVHGAIFPTRRQAPLTPAAVKASAGAVEHLRLAPVDDLPGSLADLHARGLRIVGADGDAPLSAREADLRGPIAIVVGSEGRGLGPAVRRRCDLLVRIPMHGRIESLNASVAGSILLYEAAAQRGLPEVPPTPDPEPAGEPVDAVDDESPELPTTGSRPVRTRKPRTTRPRATAPDPEPGPVADADLLPGDPTSPDVDAIAGPSPDDAADPPPDAADDPSPAPRTGPPEV